MTIPQNNGWGGRRAGSGRKFASTCRRNLRLPPELIAQAKTAKTLFGQPIEIFLEDDCPRLHPVLKIWLGQGLVEAASLSLEQITGMGYVASKKARQQIQLSIDSQTATAIDKLAKSHETSSYAITPLLIQIGRVKTERKNND